MKTLNYSKAHVISQPTLFIRRTLIAAGVAIAVAAPAWATQIPDELVSQSAGNAAIATDAIDGAVDPESAAHDKWRTLMAHNATPTEGCFHASYPNIVWESVDCKTAQTRVHPVHIKPTDAEE
jgi:hypothetical protein